MANHLSESACRRGAFSVKTCGSSGFYVLWEIRQKYTRYCFLPPDYFRFFFISIENIEDILIHSHLSSGDLPGKITL
jgi:hypothetical protein